MSGAVVIFFAGRLKWCLVVRKVPKVTEDRRGQTVIRKSGDRIPGIRVSGKRTKDKEQRTALLFSELRFLSSEQFTYSTGQLKGVEK